MNIINEIVDDLTIEYPPIVIKTSKYNIYLYLDDFLFYEIRTNINTDNEIEINLIKFFVDISKNEDCDEDDRTVLSKTYSLDDKATLIRDIINKLNKDGLFMTVYDKLYYEQKLDSLKAEISERSEKLKEVIPSKLLLVLKILKSYEGINLTRFI